MSVNASTYLKYVYTEIIADAGFEQLSATNQFVYGLQIGVASDSASATTGNWVSASSSTTVAAEDGVKITADVPFSLRSYAVGNELLALNLKDYYVATTSGDVIYMSYLEETAIT